MEMQMVNCMWQWPSPTIRLLLQVGEINRISIYLSALTSTPHSVDTWSDNKAKQMLFNWQASHRFMFIFNFSQSSTQCTSSNCSGNEQNFHQHSYHVVWGSLWSKEWSYFKLQCHLHTGEAKRHNNKTDWSSNTSSESNWTESKHKLQHHSNGFDYQRTWTS